MVDKAKFGQKHLCPTCGCKFYDMNRTPPICPRCRTNLDDIGAGPVAMEDGESGEEVEVDVDVVDDSPDDDEELDTAIDSEDDED